MLTHKGIIFDQEYLIATLSAAERRQMKNKLTIMVPQKIGKRTIHHKAFLYKNVQVVVGDSYTTRILTPRILPSIYFSFPSFEKVK